VPAPAEPAIAPKVAAVPNSLDLGEASFQARNYAKAIRYFEDYLRAHPKAANRDGVLFRLGLSLAMDSSVRNMRRAEEILKRLVAEFPASPYKGPAEFILGLQLQVESLKEDIKEKEARIKLLSEELQKLKEIDLQRRPSRPSY
jgi:outer membrane protein assembly factor BamD (BamD/ComL family)